MTNALFTCAFAVAISSGPTVLADKMPPPKPVETGVPAAIKNGVPPAQGNSEADVWATKVQKAYENVKDLSGDFEQQTRFKGTESYGPKSTGTIEVKKPGKLRWEFATPDKRSMVSDGKTLWMYDAEENQVMVNEFMRDTTSVTGLNFLEGLGDLKKSFDVTLAEMPKDTTMKDAIFLSLAPKDAEDVQFSNILLSVDKKTGLASEVFLTDPMGSVTRLTFKNLATNKNLKDARFVFEIPKGADVIKPQLLQPKQ